jgi:hypothetical protein
VQLARVELDSEKDKSALLTQTCESLIRDVTSSHSLNKPAKQKQLSSKKAVSNPA